MVAVRGLERFCAHFKGHEDAYVLIGGIACHEWLLERQMGFRATKDMDMVLILEALTPEFIRHVWSFVRAGGYAVAQRSEGERTYFRFKDPKQPDFPHMLELFSRQPGSMVLDPEQVAVPIAVGEEASSLSAILMDDDYYQLIRSNQTVLHGLPVVKLEALIPLKARAWLDLTRRRAAGQPVDSGDITKHRNDVFRLVLVLTEDGHTDLPATVKAELQAFADAHPADSMDWGSILTSLKTTVKRPPPATMLLKRLTTYFGIGK
jgi:hypothetical protein